MNIYREKTLRQMYERGYASGVKGMLPNPGIMERFAPPLDWCQTAGWFDGHQEFVRQSRGAAMSPYRTATP